MKNYYSFSKSKTPVHYPDGNKFFPVGIAKFGLSGLMLLSSFVLTNRLAAQTTHTVCASGCDFITIQSAINAASPADVIQVSAGNYSGNVTVNKALDIRGANYGINPNTSTRLDESDLNGSFTIVGGLNGVTIDGFRIANSSGNGITLGNSTGSGLINIAIRNNLLENITAGGIVESVANGFTNLTIANNRIDGFGLTANSTAILLYHSGTKTNVNITGNYVRAAETFSAVPSGARGIQLSDAVVGGSISNNTIENVGGAGGDGAFWAILSANGQSNLTIDGNIINNSGGDGIHIWPNSTNPSINVTISNNSINNVGLLGSKNFGRAIYVWSSSSPITNLTISNNTINQDVTPAYAFSLIDLRYRANVNNGPTNVTGNTINLSGTPISDGGNNGLVIRGASGVVNVNDNIFSSLVGANVIPFAVGVLTNVLGVPGAPNIAFQGTLNLKGNFLSGVDGLVTYSTVDEQISGITNNMNINVENNHFGGVTNKAIHSASGTNAINAICNWFGSTDVDFIADNLLAGNIAVTGFLTNGSDNDLTAAGFQPTPGSCEFTWLGNNGTNWNDLGNQKTLVYPNPSNGSFTVLVESTQAYELAKFQLIDISGRIVEQQNETLQNGSTAIQFSRPLNAGTYILEIHTKDGRFKPVQVVIY